MQGLLQSIRPAGTASVDSAGRDCFSRFGRQGLLQSIEPAGTASVDSAGGDCVSPLNSAGEERRAPSPEHGPPPAGVVQAHPHPISIVGLEARAAAAGSGRTRSQGLLQSIDRVSPPGQDGPGAPLKGSACESGFDCEYTKAAAACESGFDCEYTDTTSKCV